MNPACPPPDFFCGRDRLLPWLTHLSIIYLFPRVVSSFLTVSTTLSPQWHYLQLDSRHSDIIFSFLFLDFYISIYQLSSQIFLTLIFFLHFQSLNVLISLAWKHHRFSSKDNKSNYHFILFSFSILPFIRSFLFYIWREQLAKTCFLHYRPFIS